MVPAAILAFAPIMSAMLKKKGKEPKKNIIERSIQFYGYVIKNLSDEEVNKLIEEHRKKKQEKDKKRKKIAKRKRKKGYFEFDGDLYELHFYDAIILEDHYEDYEPDEYYDEADLFDYEYYLDEYEHAEPVTLSAIFAAIITFIRSAARKIKDKGGPENETEKVIVKTNDSLQSSVKESVQQDIGMKTYNVLPLIAVAAGVFLLILYLKK